jgi:hypothetical protein
MPLSIYALRIGLAAVPLALLSACASGPDHVQIKFHQLTRGDHYKCAVTDGPEKCAQIPPRAPADENKGGTSHVIPPNGCQGRFSLITIENVDSDSPAVYVVCSPLEN